MPDRPCFTKLTGAVKIETSTATHADREGAFMAVATGELIRAMNYVDDITATLRRILIYIPGMSPEERKRLAESLRGAAATINSTLADLEKAGK